MSKYNTLIDATEHANAAAAFLEGAQLAADMLSKHEFRHQPDGQTVRASVNTQSILLRQALGELDVLRSKLHEVAKQAMRARLMTPAELRACRLQLGLSQHDFGRCIGHSRFHVNHMERGRKPVAETTQRLVEALMHSSEFCRKIKAENGL